MRYYGISEMIDRRTGGLKKGPIIPASDFSFVHISDSHIGFNKSVKQDVLGPIS